MSLYTWGTRSPFSSLSFPLSFSSSFCPVSFSVPLSMNPCLSLDLFSTLLSTYVSDSCPFDECPEPFPINSNDQNRSTSTGCVGREEGNEGKWMEKKEREKSEDGEEEEEELNKGQMESLGGECGFASINYGLRPMDVASKLKDLVYGIVSVQAGGDDVAIISDRNLVYFFGDNFSYLISDEGYVKFKKPARFSTKLLTPVADAKACFSDVFFAEDDHVAKKEEPFYESIPLKCAEIALGKCFAIFLTVERDTYFCGRFSDNFPLIRCPISLSAVLPQDTVIMQVACGSTHALMLSESGLVYSIGVGNDGRLGQGDRFSSTVPSLVKYFCSGEFYDSVMFVRCGDYHSMACTSSGKLYAFGENSFGQLGLGNYQDAHEPFRVEFLEKEVIIDCAGGNKHSVVLTREGIVYTMGANEHGQLGVGDCYHRNVPTLVDTSILDGANGSRIVRVHAGGAHCVAQSISGRAITWGDNQFGQLGTGDLDLRSSAAIPILPDGVTFSTLCCGHTFTLGLTGTVEYAPHLVAGAEKTLELKSIF